MAPTTLGALRVRRRDKPLEIHGLLDVLLDESSCRLTEFRIQSSSVRLIPQRSCGSPLSDDCAIELDVWGQLTIAYIPPL
jgi:hypothetical protein